MKKIFIVGLLLVLCLIAEPVLAATDSDWYTIEEWSSKMGKGLIQETDLQSLRDLNLVDARGIPFEPQAWPAGYSELRAWLRSSQASANMAYQLAAQLAACDMNVNINSYDGNTLVYAPGTMSADVSGYAPLQDIMAEANVEIGQHPFTPPGSPYREYQKALENALDNADEVKTADQVILSGTIAGATPSMVYCWGNNDYGQAINPTGNDYIAIAGGTLHSLGLHNDGSLEAWGYNDWNQTSPLPTGTFSAIAAGYFHSLALEDGSIVGWGDPDYLDIPNGNDYDAIDAATFHSLALHSDGSIEAWGLDVYGQISTTPTDQNYKAIAAGEVHNLALRSSDGSIASWGDDSDGQVSDTPTGTGFKAIAQGTYHCLALRSDNTLVGWGWNYYGQATPPAGNDYVAIAAGFEHSLAMHADGTLEVWGPETSLAVINTPSGSGFATISAGDYHNIALNPLDIIPPASVTNLQNTTNTNSSITWTWINPPDTDFDLVDIYLNGTFVDSVGSGGQSYTAPGLMANTEYILGTRTVDISGMINSTMVTDSAWTAPDAQFSASPTSGVAPLTVQFTDESPGSGILTYEWDFDNDGSVDGEEQNPSIDFGEGTYTVKLTVTGPGGSDEEIKVEYILVTSTPTAPVAQFSATPLSGLIPLTVQFTDLSTGSGPLTYYWDFQNNGIVDSNEQNPSFTYTSVGNYTVNLTVSNSGGPNSEVKQNFVFAFNPVQGYTKAPTDPDNDGRFEDLTGNGLFTYVDINVFYNRYNWVKENEPVYAFDFSGNGAITYVDVTKLFNHPPITA